MRNTPPEKTLVDRDNDRVIEDLCIALRNVGISERTLPSGQKVITYIEQVVEINLELKRRQIEFDNRLVRLGEETGWNMTRLLKECLAYPDELPRVQLKNGRFRFEIEAEMARAREIEDEKRDAEIAPYVEGARKIINEHVGLECDREELLAILERGAIRALFEKIAKCCTKPLSKAEQEILNHLMSEWG